MLSVFRFAWDQVIHIRRLKRGWRIFTPLLFLMLVWGCSVKGNDTDGVGDGGTDPAETTEDTADKDTTDEATDEEESEGASESDMDEEESGGSGDDGESESNDGESQNDESDDESKDGETDESSDDGESGGESDDESDDESDSESDDGESDEGESDEGESDEGESDEGGTDVDDTAEIEEQKSLPEESRVVEHVLNLVGEALYADFVDFFDLPPEGSEEEDNRTLAGPARAFYEYYPDEYDFLMFVGIEELSDEVGGQHERAYTPEIPGVGVERYSPVEWPGSDGRLMSIIGLDFKSFDERPPMAHEVLHHWGVYLDEALGFGDGYTGGKGAHWGSVSVDGQLGGFNGDSLRCKIPEDAIPPDCTPEANGRVHYIVDLFSPLTGVDSEMPYAPLELYLMGLVSADEIPQSYTLLEDAATTPVEYNSGTGQYTVDAAGSKEITVDDILSIHGESSLLSESERQFTGALVVLSPEPASDEMMEVASKWAETFGGHADGEWPSFEEMTGGRATMSMRLGARRSIDDDYNPDPLAPRCDVYEQDCEEGLACYKVEQPTCMMEGDGQLGDPCVYYTDCVGGMACPPGDLCAPYCELDNEESATSCATLCPGAYGIIMDDKTGEEAGGLCAAGAGDGACDPMQQDCGEGRGCYGIYDTACQAAGVKTEGEACDPVSLSDECIPGTTCIGIEGESTSYCAYFCEYAGQGENGCDTLCLADAWEFEGYGICIPYSDLSFI